VQIVQKTDETLPGEHSHEGVGRGHGTALLNDTRTDRAKEQEKTAKKIEQIEAKVKKIREFLSTHQPKVGSALETGVALLTN
jgi:polyribonucleotide nucleotidyltransferase